APGGTAGSAAPGARAGHSEVEDAPSFEEEVALFRELQVESREIYLLFVDLDLREVGVEGKVGGQAGRDPVLHVQAGIDIRFIGEPGRIVAAGLQPGDPVRLDLQIPARRWRLEADQRRGLRDPEPTRCPRSRDSSRDERDMGPLVPATD